MISTAAVEAVIGWLDDDGRLVIRSSTQVPFLTRDEIAALQGATLLEFGTAWCGWCRRVMPERSGPGRPAKFCSQKCRQWNWVARQRASVESSRAG